MSQLVLFILLSTSLVWADPSSKKQIDFEGDVVEGVNKQPLDSLNQIADGNGGRGRLHLYRRKRTPQSIKAENRESLREFVETY